MADVAGRPAEPGRLLPERGQLLLVTGLIMAVTFVLLALTLNTVIYTENLATRSSDIAGADNSIRYLDATERGLQDMVAHVNRNHNGSHDDVRDNVTTDVDAWRNTTGRLFAVDGVATNISDVQITDGSRIQQTNSSRNFTAANGDATWTVASDVSGTRQFWLNVTRASLTDTTKALLEVDNVFYVQFNDQSVRRKVFIYSNLTGTSTVNVTVKNMSSGTKSTPCSSTDAETIVNLTAGTVGGESCSALSFVADLDSPYSIAYNDTTLSGIDSGNGTYQAILDNDSVARNPGPFLNDGPGDSPWADAAAYAVDVNAIYETVTLRYNSSVRVAPGEADD